MNNLNEVERFLKMFLKANFGEVQAVTWELQGGHDDLATIELFSVTERQNLLTLNDLPLRAATEHLVRAVAALSGRTTGMIFL